MTPSNYLTATETQQLLRSGEIDEDQILADHVGRYGDRDGEIGAWVHVNFHPDVMGPKNEREKALHGVVLGVKDIMSKCSRSHCTLLYRTFRLFENVRVYWIKLMEM